MRPPRTSLWLLFMSIVVTATDWKCPEINQTNVSCSCDFPHSLRCTATAASMNAIREKLKSLTKEESVSLLDCTIQNLTVLPDSVLEGVAIHGLVVTGELKNVSAGAFYGLLHPLQALGLPGNRLTVVPTAALSVLKELERLDLSHNVLTRIDSSSFRGLINLTFLDISENRISEIAVGAFKWLKNLKVVNFSGNKMAVLPALNNVEEADLSTNSLSGPLREDTLPSLPSLRTLFLANNQFSSICRDALSGASSLTTLSLKHNNIDVLEDHAFRSLTNLRNLDLSHNRIVAISSSSLAHLRELTELNLSHNFLRVLTSDIVTPLVNLRILHLDDNDISMIESEWLTENMPLERLTLSDNPLNCDCTMVDFAAWFCNSSRLSSDDRSTAVCMTPPHLENAVLTEVHPSEFVCEDSDEDFPISTHVSGAQIVLRAFNFDGSAITLLWSIDTHVQAFTCDALFVYEEMSTHEVLLNSTPLRCNSSQLVDPTTLAVRVPLGNMQRYHRYRYCVVLLEDSRFSDEMQLILGCSEIIPLLVTESSVPQPTAVVHTRITALDANVSFDVLTISVKLQSDGKSTHVRCHVTVTVFMTSTLLTQHVLNCTNPRISISGLPPGHYHVCASLGSYTATETKLQCVTVGGGKLRGSSGSLLIICFVLATAFTAFGVYLCAKKAIHRSRSPTHQCFLASNDLDDDEHKQHSRYVKLQSTTIM